jgi:cytochrome d ubiquinol oxidase subunit II
MFLVQGSTWLALKSQDALYGRAVAARGLLQKVFAGVVVLATAATFLLVPTASSAVLGSVFGWVFLALLLVALGWGFFAHAKSKDRMAWYAASLASVALVGMWAVSIFPNLVPAINDSALSLTLSNASSSQLTLKVMLIIAVIGVPIVLAYTALIYKTFVGKVSARGEGY